MKDDRYQKKKKNTWKYDIFRKCSGNTLQYDLSCIIRKDDISISSISLSGFEKFKSTFPPI